MNSISLISVAELLDGRYFFIPAYQRGFRWGEKQMEDLLNDLYEFAIRKKKDGEFYCLQPVIVQPILDEKRLDEIKAITDWNVTPESTWEVVDGQQRLTSLYILLRYLIDNEIFRKIDLKSLQPYRLCYETRPESKEFLENLTSETLSRDTIDLSHITGAFIAIDNWLETKAPEIAARYGKKKDPSSILEQLKSILSNTRDDYAEAAGSAQFIWYQLSPDSTKNPIDEFININNGKIRLTDAELIKGLFLLKRNFAADKDGEQMKLAMQWEIIENKLHQNDFWNFLSSSVDADNRIELLFTLLYLLDHPGTKDSNIKDSDLFRHYYDLLSVDNDKENVIVAEWNRVLKLFSILEGWYEDPILYNTVGFLIHSGVKLNEIVSLNQSINANSDKHELEKKLHELIAKQLPSEEDVVNNDIQYNYHSDKRKIRSLLLFLNIYMLNCQMAELRKKNRTLMTPAYKFPFDLYVSQDWDVEHIDSATQNSLKTTDDRQAMIEASINALELQNDNEIQQWMSAENPDYVSAWNKILQYSGGIGSDDEHKNSIGNLTLLDAETNRSYQNAVFANKRIYIHRVMQEGTFVPLCTQLVFNKGFEKQTTDLRQWSDKDKELYTEFILVQLRKFYGIEAKADSQLSLEIDN